jgi:hypothetical protein
MNVAIKNGLKTNLQLGIETELEIELNQES